MSTPEEEAESSETAFTYTPNYHSIFSSQSQSVTNGTSSVSNSKRNDFAAPSMPNICNQTVQAQPLQQQQQTQSQPLQYQPRQYQPQQQQQQLNPHSASLIQSGPQIQPQPQSQPQSQSRAQNSPNSVVQYHLQIPTQQHVHSSTQPQRVPQHQQNPMLLEPRDNRFQNVQRVLNSDSNSNVNPAQIPSRSVSVPNLEQQQTQSPTRNVSTSYISPSTTPIIQPPIAHQPTTYQLSSEQVQSTLRNVQTSQNNVNQGYQQHNFSSNQQSSSENQRNLNQLPYSYAHSLPLSQQSQSRVIPNLNPSPPIHVLDTQNYAAQRAYYNPQVLRPTVQQVVQNQIQTQSYNSVSTNFLVRPATLPTVRLGINQQSQQNQCANQYPQVGLLLNTPMRPNSNQQNMNNVTYDAPCAPSEIVNNTYLARALGTVRCSNMEPLQDSRILQNQQNTDCCNIRPPPTNTSFNQVPNSNSSDYNNCRWRLAQHVEGRRASSTQPNSSHLTTNANTATTAITTQFSTPASSHITTPSTTRPHVVVASTTPAQNLARSSRSSKTQSIGTQTENLPETANKAMQFDGKLKSVENKALNATVTMEDKECQTDETEDRPVVTKIYVDRACSPLLSVGLATLLANNEPKKSIPVRMKKTSKRKDLSAGGTDPKVRKRESSSDTDVDIETLE